MKIFKVLMGGFIMSISVIGYKYTEFYWSLLWYFPLYVGAIIYVNSINEV